MTIANTSSRSGLAALRTARILLAAIVVALAFGPIALAANELKLLTEFFCLLVIALMWNLLAGYADIVSVGQHAFVGIGAYAFYGFTVHLGLDPFAAIGMAGLVALAFAVPSLIVIFRLRAAYLAVGTWVLAEVLMLIAGKLPGFGGGSGVSLPVAVVREFGAQPAVRLATIYWLSFGLALFAFASTFLLMRSRIGLGLTAMRDNEEGAGAVGVDLIRTRVICFLWTAPFLGLAGALITLQKLRIAPPASFSITDWTVFVIFIVVIGGIGSFEGPVLGCILYFVLREYLAGLGAWNLIILGSVSIAMIIVEPRGLWGIARRFLPGNVLETGYGGLSRREKKRAVEPGLAADSHRIY